MRLAHVTRLESFGTRSLVVHGIMVLTFAGALLSGLFVDGQIGLVSFVALLNFTAGLWVAHSIHSLGNVGSGDEYSGVLNELLNTDGEAGGRTDSEVGGRTDGEVGGRTDSEAADRFDTGRFGRLVALIGAVTAVSLLTSAQVLGGALFSIAIVAVGTIALITAMIGFLIAMGASYDESQERTAAAIDRNADGAGVDVNDVPPSDS